MGLRFVTTEPEAVVVELEIGEEHLQPFGLVHGGVHAGLVETVCSVGAQLNAPKGMQIVGVENHTSFLRPAKKGRLVARGTPVHVGRRAQLWQAEIHDGDGRLLARGTLRLLAVEATNAHAKPGGSDAS